MIDDHLWGNVYGKDCLVRIDRNTGSVTAWGLLDRRSANAEAAAARRDPPDVLNGIAYDAESKRLFVTGKLWPTLYEIEIIPAETSLQKARKFCIPTVNIFRRR